MDDGDHLPSSDSLVCPPLHEKMPFLYILENLMYLLRSQKLERIDLATDQHKSKHKYSNLDHMYVFDLFGVDTLGYWGRAHTLCINQLQNSI